jgi:nitrate/TMAO reductase-like tetraheme cytochrome c subunit
MMSLDANATRKGGFNRMRLPAKILAHPILALAVVLTFAGVAAAAVPAFQATEKPAFCRTCHEMVPYHEAWAAGTHSSVDCVDCHVDAGTVNHVKHKVVATQELWVHLTGDPRFPQGTAEVPDARCLRCHDRIRESTGPRFSHKKHAGSAPCVSCHAEVGHRVTTAALAKAGVLATGSPVTTGGTPTGPGGAVPASNASTATAHPKTTCSRCHDPAKTACSTCHTPTHTPRGECTTCHRPGPRWSFSHPVSEDCAKCHAAPARHFGPVCASCHAATVPFAKTVYTHVSSDCASCHARPAKHFPGACTVCHSPSVAFARAVFRHTSNGCASCHTPPAGHNRAVSCASCHRKAGSWAHSHPSSSGCASCHKAPAGHNRALACASCHRKPGSWAASHPASSKCGSCHAAPSGHYGSSCASCHRPGVAWRSATFRHPSTGSEHTYRSFACVKCHPSGYSSHTCTACHGANGGGD